jgi:hypothetical protein
MADKEAKLRQETEVFSWIPHRSFARGPACYCRRPGHHSGGSLALSVLGSAGDRAEVTTDLSDPVRPVRVQAALEWGHALSRGCVGRR